MGSHSLVKADTELKIILLSQHIILSAGIIGAGYHAQLSN